MMHISGVVTRDAEFAELSLIYECSQFVLQGLVVLVFRYKHSNFLDSIR
jgi:hypothetical protein